MMDRFLIRNESVELMRFSKDGIWVNPDIPVDEVALRVFAVLEPLIRQAYAVAAAEADASHGARATKEVQGE
jgi:hypothetical protein